MCLTHQRANVDIILSECLEGQIQSEGMQIDLCLFDDAVNGCFQRFAKKMKIRDKIIWCNMIFWHRQNCFPNIKHFLWTSWGTFIQQMRRNHTFLDFNNSQSVLMAKANHYAKSSHSCSIFHTPLLLVKHAPNFMSSFWLTFSMLNFVLIPKRFPAAGENQKIVLSEEPLLRPCALCLELASRNIIHLSGTITRFIKWYNLFLS